VQVDGLARAGVPGRRDDLALEPGREGCPDAEQDVSRGKGKRSPGRCRRSGRRRRPGPRRHLASGRPCGPAIGGGVHGSPDGGGQPLRVRTGGRVLLPTRRTEAQRQHPLRRCPGGRPRGLVVRAQVLDAVPAAGFELDRVGLGQARHVTGQRDSVLPDGGRGEAQRPRVWVAEGVAHRRRRHHRAEPVVVGQHGPRGHRQAAGAQRGGGALERTRRPGPRGPQPGRPQRGPAPAGRIGAVVDRRVPRDDPVTRVERGHRPDRVVGGGQGHPGQPQPGKTVRRRRVAVHVPRVEVRPGPHTHPPRSGDWSVHIGQGELAAEVAEHRIGGNGLAELGDHLVTE